MVHEQRIGRIDRPRHQDDSAPLDIYYFLNFDLIESELRLRERLEKRLKAAYQDTGFDDEILPGYFDMIEQFSKLRKEQETNNTYVAEANAILEEIAERGVQPSEVAVLDNELERKALFRLQEVARSQAPVHRGERADRPLVSIGRIPYDDLNGAPHSTCPISALVAEIQFRGGDQRQTHYQHFYVALNEEQNVQDNQLNITIESEYLLPVIEGFLADLSSTPLKHKHIVHLQALLLKLEAVVQQELKNMVAMLKRNRRYYNLNSSIGEQGEKYAIEAHLANVRFLI
jgi:hypothetical protein